MTNYSRIDPVVLTVRVFKDKIDPTLPLNIHNPSDIVMVATVILDSCDNTAIVTAASGTFNRTIFREMIDHIKKLGVKTISWQRYKKDRTVKYNMSI